MKLSFTEYNLPIKVLSTLLGKNFSGSQVEVVHITHHLILLDEDDIRT